MQYNKQDILYGLSAYNAHCCRTFAACNNNKMMTSQRAVL